MSEIKVSLNISLQGRTMLSQEEANTLEKQGLAGYDNHSLVVEEYNKKSKKTIKETLHFRTRRSIPAVQSINISKEAYDYMVSKEAPSFCNAHDWNRMGKKAKLEMHLKEIAEGLKGKVLSYHIFEE